MTFYLLDVASYQGTLSPDDVKRAGFDAVNLKISHGLTQKSVHPHVDAWAASAGMLGLGVSTFHYLDASASGQAQAEYAYSRLVALGLTDGTAHQVDTEASATWEIVRDYSTTMQTLLGRPVVVYTGDWWWTDPKRRWAGSGVTPYLWAAPNAGYPGSYPGDTSPEWTAGYGGWKTLAIMQYAVAPLSFPDGTRGTIDVSKSAIRDPAVWRDLTEGRQGMTFAPDSLVADRQFLLHHLTFTDGPLSLGIVGDDNHAASGSSYHLGKSANRSDSYSIVESSRDKNGLTEAASALDVGRFSVTVGGRTHNLRTFSTWLVGQCSAGAADTKDIREVIYSPDGVVVKRWDRLGKRTTGDSSHLVHTHISRFRDAQNRGLTPLFTRYFVSIGLMEDDMADFTEAQYRVFPWQFAGAPFPAGKSTASVLTEVWTNTQAATLTLAAILTAVNSNADTDAVVAAVNARAAELQAAVANVDEEVWAKVPDPDISAAEKAALLRAVLGDDAQAVGAILAAG